MSNLTGGSDGIIRRFEPQLLTVMKELDKKIIDLVGSMKLSADTYDAAALLNSRGAMIAALRESGYNDLVEAYVKEYESIPALIRKDFDTKGFPPIKFATADVQTFQQIAAADLEAFSVIGTKAMDDLRLGLYKQAVSSAPFSEMVETIRHATVGETRQAISSKTGKILLKKDGTPYKRSPLANHSYTYANTSFQSFGGEVSRIAGEALGAEKWEVVGPNDNVTRDECIAALNNPVRTKEEWQSAGYWGGWRWNCRHLLDPVVDDK